MKFLQIDVLFMKLCQAACSIVIMLYPNQILNGFLPIVALGMDKNKSMQLHGTLRTFR